MTSRRHMSAAAILLMACTLILAARANAQEYPVTTGVLKTSTTTPVVGGSFSVSGGGCAPGATVTVAIDGGATLGTTSANGAGDFSTSVQLPANTSPGTTAVNATCSTGSGTLVLGVTVSVQPTSSRTPTTPPASNSGAGPLAATGAYLLTTASIAAALALAGGTLLMLGRRLRND